MRRDGWESLLASYLADDRPFEWGERDCALWSAEWVEICTGRDFISGWKGKYKTGPGAMKLMKKRGFSGPEDIASAHLEEIPVRLAMRGDLLLHPDKTLGICAGLNGHFLTESGTTQLSTLGCPRAWRV